MQASRGSSRRCRISHHTFYPDETDAAAKAEKPPEAGGDGGGGSKGRLFTPDGKLVYVNVYSTAPDADRKGLVKFANDVVMPRLRRIKGMEVTRDLAKGHSAVRVRLNPDQMRAHNLSSEDIIEQLDERPSEGSSRATSSTRPWGRCIGGRCFRSPRTS